MLRVFSTLKQVFTQRPGEVAGIIFLIGSIRESSERFDFRLLFPPHQFALMQKKKKKLLVFLL